MSLCICLQETVSGNMLVPVVRLLNDPVERCREGTVTFLASAAEQLPEPAALLSYLMPAVADRMGEVPVVEPSEELRLALIKLIAGPIILRSGQGLLPYLSMIVKVICRALEDPFHDIKKVGRWTNNLEHAWNPIAAHSCIGTSTTPSCAKQPCSNEEPMLHRRQAALP